MSLKSIIKNVEITREEDVRKFVDALEEAKEKKRGSENKYNQFDKE